MAQVVPSLIGYGYSSSPPVDKDFTMIDCARVLDSLMTGLGYSTYAVQGGDVGAFIGREISAKHDACKALHINMCFMQPPDNFDYGQCSELEMKGVAKLTAWSGRGLAYAQTHATRTSTISLILSSSPVALLAWFGALFLISLPL